MLKRREYQITLPVVLPVCLTLPVCLPRKLYMGQEATVRSEHGTVDRFTTGKEVWPGWILSPCLFNLYAEYILWNPRLDEITGCNKDCWEKYQPQICSWYHSSSRKWGEQKRKSLLMRVKEESGKVHFSLHGALPGTLMPFPGAPLDLEARAFLKKLLEQSKTSSLVATSRTISPTCPANPLSLLPWVNHVPCPGDAKLRGHLERQWDQGRRCRHLKLYGNIGLSPTRKWPLTRTWPAANLMVNISFQNQIKPWAFGVGALTPRP